YYNQLASEAAESGMTRADDCLRASGYIASWTTGSQLRPNTSCAGGNECTGTSSCFVTSNARFRTTFEVGVPVGAATSQTVTVTGKVQLLGAASGKTWRTYSATYTARVGTDVAFNAIAFGYTNQQGAFFLTIAADGALRGVGSNYYGQLGDGTTVSNTKPTTYTLASGADPIQVYAGFLSQGFNSYVRTSDGRLFAAGLNNHGQLGDNTKTDRSTAVQVQMPAGVRAIGLYPNGRNAFVLGDDNRLYAMGECIAGQLGSGYSIAGCLDQVVPKQVSLPAYSAGDLNTHPTARISADATTVYVIMEGGRVYGWGGNTYGQLAKGDTTDSSTPVKIGTFGDTGKPKAISIAFDGDDLTVVDSNGLVGTVGRNRFGMLGNGTTTQSNTLVNFPLPPGSGKAIKASSDHSSVSVLTDAGQVWSAGLNDKGQLGNGAVATNQTTPVRFILPAGVLATDLYSTSTGLASDFSNLFVVGSNGRVYGAGSNVFGQLGNGTMTAYQATPVVMGVIDGTVIRASSVQSGYGTTIILTTNNKIYTVGHNDNGQLGDGTTTDSSTPVANRYTNVIPFTFY
ncbi:MAG: hypothetical protein ABIR91_01405, partial [Candidatus Saccharimonadales bacterium]